MARSTQTHVTGGTWLRCRQPDTRASCGASQIVGPLGSIIWPAFVCPVPHPVVNQSCSYHRHQLVRARVSIFCQLCLQWWHIGGLKPALLARLTPQKWTNAGIRSPSYPSRPSQLSHFYQDTTECDMATHSHRWGARILGFPENLHGPLSGSRCLPALEMAPGAWRQNREILKSATIIYWTWKGLKKSNFDESVSFLNP